MKKLTFLISALLLLGQTALFTACDSSDDNTATASLTLTDINTQEITSIELPADGCLESNDYRVYVSATGASWDARLESEEWCTMVQAAVRVTLHAAANTTGETRSTRLIVTAGDIEKSVTITQPAYDSPFGEMTYENMLGNFRIANFQGEDVESTYQEISFSEGQDYIDGSGQSYRAYDVKGWGTLVPELYNDTPARAIFFHDNVLNCNYVYLITSQYGEKTVNVPDWSVSEDGSTKKEVTSTFLFAGLWANLSDTTVEPMVATADGLQLYVIGVDSKTGALFMDYSRFTNETTGDMFACSSCNYWYIADSATGEALAADTRITPDITPDIPAIVAVSGTMKMVSSLGKPEFNRATIRPLRGAAPAGTSRISIQKID